VTLVRFTVLGHHHYYAFPELFQHPKQKLFTLNSNSSFPSYLQPLVTSISSYLKKNFFFLIFKGKMESGVQKQLAAFSCLSVEVVN